MADGLRRIVRSRGHLEDLERAIAHENAVRKCSTGINRDAHGPRDSITIVAICPAGAVGQTFMSFLQCHRVFKDRQECLPCRRSEEHTSELQSRLHLVCRLLLEKKKKQKLSVKLTPPLQRGPVVRLFRVRYKRQTADTP